MSDTYNSRVRQVYNGIVHSVAGNGSSGYAGDGGPALAAELNTPSVVSFVGSSSAYYAVSDTYNNRVRLINADGVIFTLCGNGSAGYSGDYGPASAAQLYWPTGVLLDHVSGIVCKFMTLRVRCDEKLSFSD